MPVSSLGSAEDIDDSGITVTERFAMRRSNAAQVSRSYNISGTTDDMAARDAMLNDTGLCPLTVEVGVPGGTWTFIRDIKNCDVVEVGNGLWIGTCTWVNPVDIRPPGYFQYSFDISGQQQKILHSRATTSSTAISGVTAPNFKGAIGVNVDGQVEGCDILIPAMSFTMQVTFADMSTSYMSSVSEIVGTTNNATFQGFAAGELLLTRVCGQQRNDGNWDVTFQFAVSKNETNYPVGGTSLVIANKVGWEYAWVWFTEQYDSTSHCWNRIPTAVYTEQVYRSSDYLGLGIS